MEKNYTFTQKVVITTAIVILFVAGVALLIYTINFFFLIFAAILFAVMLRAIANWIHDKLKLPQGIALAIATLSFFGILFLTGWLIAPTIQQQAAELRETIPESVRQLKEQIGESHLGERAMNEIDLSQDGILPDTEDMLYRVGNVFSSTISILTNLFIVIVIGIFFASSPASYQKGNVKLFPPRYCTRLWEVLDMCYDTLRWWLFGKLITMVFVGVLSAIGLMVLGIPMALAVIAFFLDFIPTIGPILAAIPAVLIAFLISPMTALYVAILYFVIHSIESYLLAPIIFQKTVSISPVLTLLSLVLFGILVGPMGVILAASLVAVLQVFIKELYIKDYLEAGARATTDVEAAE